MPKGTCMQEIHCKGDMPEKVDVLFYSLICTQCPSHAVFIILFLLCLNWSKVSEASTVVLSSMQFRLCLLQHFLTPDNFCFSSTKTSTYQINF